MKLTELCSANGGSGFVWIVRGAVAVAAATAGAYGLFRFMGKTRRRVVGIIPARVASSRFPGKPLALILGKPMIQRTWERAKLASSLDSVVVATDDEEIAECCLGFGADIAMTSELCSNGTERCYEALRHLPKKYDIVVNIQGDEPLMDPLIINGVVESLQMARDAVCSTAVTSLKPEDAADPNRVKCVVDMKGYAMYFSRALIPSNKSGVFNPNFPYMLHLGIQAYDVEFLNWYTSSKSSEMQVEEDLEQLKVLENGYKMKVIKVDHQAHGVDTLQDVQKIEEYMRTHHIL